MGILLKSERGSSDRFDLKPQEPEPSSDRTALERQIRTLLNKYHRLYGRKPDRHKEGKHKRQSRSNPRHGGKETLYNDTCRQTSSQETGLTVNRAKHFKNQKGLRSSVESHVRYDVDVVIKEITYKVETVTDPSTGQSVRASTAEHGPAGWQITWNAIVNIVHLIVVFSMPAHRAAAFLGNDKRVLSETTLHRVIWFAAACCAPVYKEIFKQMAQSRRIQGDDSSTRVLAVEKEKAEIEPPLLSIKEAKGDIKNESSSIENEIASLDELIGFEFTTKTGRPKKKLQVTMVTGRVVVADQFSQISIVRTHLGAFGNLLDKLLLKRKEISTPEPDKAQPIKEFTVQSDLSSANRPSSSFGFEIEYAGCLAHARRPFWRYRDVDPLNCYFLLRGFALLSVVEDIIDCNDRTDEVSLYWRGKYGRKIWEIMKARCEEIQKQNMPNSELHRAASYVINHFEELTHYLTDPWISPTNNQVERILRSERTMLNNSKFRQSKKGRVAFDILRTIQLCCSGAQVPFLEYMKWLLPNSEKAKLKPQDWTPYAYRLNILPKP